MNKTAIIYHYLALYRLPIFSELMQSEKIEFTIYSGIESEIDIKKIDFNLSKVGIEDKGLRWNFLKNRWLFNKKFLWQKGLLKVAMFGYYDSYVFLGSPYHLSTWLAVMILRCRKKKVYYWMHGVYKDSPKIIDFLKLKLFYKLPTGFFLYGNRALDVLKKYKVKSLDNMHVIYNSLDYLQSIQKRRLVLNNEINNYRTLYFNDPTIPVVVFIGRLNNIKRIDMLIDAQNLLKISTKKVRFNILILGDGEERIRLEEQVLSLDLNENVKFLGAVYNEEIIAEAIMYADICVTPGEVGLTAIHAMAYGTPVISHDNFNIQMPEVEAIKDGITGAFYSYGSVESLAQTIGKWLLDYPIKTHDVMNNCFSVIDTHYNPIYQRKVFESVLK